ncbi:hypothetical protein EVAR_16815_1 [Eumeta japonica]|uniref:Uncharacterized protein n=1 Tax=Eumeta variegata TaxID=151549 RepID=A0A4C1V1J5_EUMVA|nr:hypothetical protein EVAR_16815_1 [Eumeta japonica]
MDMSPRKGQKVSMEGEGLRNESISLFRSTPHRALWDSDHHPGQRGSETVRDRRRDFVYEAQSERFNLTPVKNSSVDLFMNPEPRKLQARDQTVLDLADFAYSSKDSVKPETCGSFAASSARAESILLYQLILMNAAKAVPRTFLQIERTSYQRACAVHTQILVKKTWPDVHPSPLKGLNIVTQEALVVYCITARGDVNKINLTKLEYAQRAVLKITLFKFSRCNVTDSTSSGERVHGAPKEVSFQNCAFVCACVALRGHLNPMRVRMRRARHSPARP